LQARLEGWVLKTKAVRLYGKNDLRLEEFQLPEIAEGEILARVVSDSLCMSSYKAASQGAAHKRVPQDIAGRPVIIGHEFCGEIVAVGGRWRHKWREGMKFAIQPAINYRGSLDAPGYSFPHLGGDATYVIIPSMFMEEECLLPYDGQAYFYGSLAEPMSCIAGAFHANYHTRPGSYVHAMGIARGGNLAVLGGAGTMGLGTAQYALGCGRRPGLIAVIDIDGARLKRAEAITPPAKAAEKGIKLVYFNLSASGNPVRDLLGLTGGRGYDDVFVYAPVRQAAEMGGALLGLDGCLNFFAGPTDPAFSADFNFYNVHYARTHVVGTSGGNTADMLEALSMMEQGLLDPAVMITHIGGLDAVAQATLRLPELPGGKKLIYTHISMPLTAIADFAALGEKDPLFAELHGIVERNNGLWCAEAERYLLERKAEVD
jgi:threonine dehydrogenase-like Zn-dependent dehydrogenase